MGGHETRGRGARAKLGACAPSLGLKPPLVLVLRYFVAVRLTFCHLDLLKIGTTVTRQFRLFYLFWYSRLEPVRRATQTDGRTNNSCDLSKRLPNNVLNNTSKTVFHRKRCDGEEVYKRGGTEIARPDIAAPDMCIKIFQKKTKKVQQLLLPQFASTYAMVNFEKVLVAGFQHVYTLHSTATLHVVAGCWCQYAHAIIKRTNKVGLKEAYGSDSDVQTSFTVCQTVSGESAAALGAHT